MCRCMRGDDFVKNAASSRGDGRSAGAKNARSAGAPLELAVNATSRMKSKLVTAWALG